MLEPVGHNKGPVKIPGIPFLLAPLREKTRLILRIINGNGKQGYAKDPGRKQISSQCRARYPPCQDPGGCGPDHRYRKRSFRPEAVVLHEWENMAIDNADKDAPLITSLQMLFIHESCLLYE
ncbi:unnamed protein product [Nezara viridula]|uniref:Uncharacterized protein n=1 Tax=Nezara viridula TaxID=85310 RepID=A0A9P0H901_NEZVI|nr:unnamed protein product [Nezara viridula]